MRPTLWLRRLARVVGKALYDLSSRLARMSESDASRFESVVMGPDPLRPDFSLVGTDQLLEELSTRHDRLIVISLRQTTDTVVGCGLFTKLPCDCPRCIGSYVGMALAARQEEQA